MSYTLLRNEALKLVLHGIFLVQYHKCNPKTTKVKVICYMGVHYVGDKVKLICLKIHSSANSCILDNYMYCETREAIFVTHYV